jgi:hypothetical protein
MKVIRGASVTSPSCPASFVQQPERMRAAQHLTLARVAWSFCLVASAACRSVPEESPRPIARAASHEEELTLIRADSEVFDAVVRAQLAGGDDEYPYHLERLRYDSRPYGTPSGYPEVFSGVQGIDPSLSFPRPGKPAINRLAKNRKLILQMNGVPEGRPVSYSQCAGVREPTPPPPRGSTSGGGSKKPADMHAGCPRTPEHYLTVGLPIRGQPAGLRDARDSRGERVSLNGDIWTTLVDVHSAGPNGWSWSQYAWLFRRDGFGRPVLASTILITVIE